MFVSSQTSRLENALLKKQSEKAQEAWGHRRCSGGALSRQDTVSFKILRALKFTGMLNISPLVFKIQDVLGLFSWCRTPSSALCQAWTLCSLGRTSVIVTFSWSWLTSQGDASWLHCVSAPHTAPYCWFLLCVSLVVEIFSARLGLFSWIVAL